MTSSATGTEEFRTLRSRLYQTARKGCRSRSCWSPARCRKKESLSSSANLAQVLVRQHGRRVLLIDGDLRAPRLHMVLGTESAPGLSDYLAGESDEFSIMQRGPMENLFFIPRQAARSRIRRSWSRNGRLKMLLQRVEPLFDWIIIDSPPAVPVSDASQLAKLCDGVLMVVRSNATPYDMARKARQEFAGQAMVGVVLNGISEDPPIPYAAVLLRVYQKKPTTLRD